MQTTSASTENKQAEQRITTQPAHSNTSTEADNKATTKATAAAATHYIIPLSSLATHTNRSSAAPLLIPPLYFSLVYADLYRSACPSVRNITFLSRLDLKSIVYLGGRDSAPYDTTDNADSSSESTHHSHPPAGFHSFLQTNNIHLRCFPTETNREPFISIDAHSLQQAIVFVVDKRNQPVLVHCSKGKHRTGCFVGLLRRLAGHSLSSIFAEYRQFLGDSGRDLDRLFIECFDLQACKREIETCIPVEYRSEWIR